MPPRRRKSGCNSPARSAVCRKSARRRKRRPAEPRRGRGAASFPLSSGLPFVHRTPGTLAIGSYAPVVFLRSFLRVHGVRPRGHRRFVPQRLHLPAAAGPVGQRAAPFVLPAVQGADRVVRKPAGGELARPARTLRALPRAHRRALSARGTAHGAAVLPDHAPFPGGLAGHPALLDFHGAGHRRHVHRLRLFHHPRRDHLGLRGGGGGFELRGPPAHGRDIALAGAVVVGGRERRWAT